MLYYDVNEEEILKALEVFGLPSRQELRKYPWFERAEARPDINIPIEEGFGNVYSHTASYDDQNYLFPGLATPFEMYGQGRQDTLEYVPNEVVSEKFHLGENWGIPVESQEHGNLLGYLISQYMGSLNE